MIIRPLFGDGACVASTMGALEPYEAIGINVTGVNVGDADKVNPAWMTK